jgi:hypothetical protein
MNYISRLLLEFAVIAGCFSLVSDALGQNTLPKELRNKYPDDRFIVRSGTGNSSESAAEAARFEIAKYFESRISGESLVRDYAKSQTARGKTTEDRFTEISNTILISASRDIPGIQIVSTEQDKNGNSCEAWAVLEKRAYSDFLNERIRSIDSKTDMTLSDVKGDDLKRVRTYSHVMSNLLLREQARQDLMLLDSGAGVASKEALLYNVMSSLDSLISDAFDVGLVFESNVDGDIKSGIIKAINDAGIRIKEYPDISTGVADGIDFALSVNHIVTSRTSSKEFNKKTFTFYFSNWVLSVKAMDPETNQAIDTFVQKDETNGGNEEQAQSRMKTKILQTHVPAVSKWVKTIIFKPGE